MKNLVKSVLTGIALGTAVALTPNISEACPNEDKRTFLDVIRPIIKNPEIIQKDKDGKVYARFTIPLEVINDISLHSERYNLVSTDGQEPFYGTLDEALRTLKSEDTYIGEFDLRDSINQGRMSNIYDKSGKKLKAFAKYRCPDSPLIFEK